MYRPLVEGMGLATSGVAVDVLKLNTPTVSAEMGVKATETDVKIKAPDICRPEPLALSVAPEGPPNVRDPAITGLPDKATLGIIIEPVIPPEVLTYPSWPKEVSVTKLVAPGNVAGNVRAYPVARVLGA